MAPQVVPSEATDTSVNRAVDTGSSQSVPALFKRYTQLLVPMPQTRPLFPTEICFNNPFGNFSYDKVGVVGVGVFEGLSPLQPIMARHRADAQTGNVFM